MKTQAARLAPIGLFDSGVGGFSVMREVFRQLPAESVHYLGDSARVPYGGRPAHELIGFNREILAYLSSEGAKAVLVACNTSCATALELLRPECPVPIVGLIEAGARSALARGSRVAVLATETTVRSGAYERALGGLDPGAEVVSVACPEWVPLVEAGADGDHAYQVVRATLAPLLGMPLDAVVLGCTHYPLLAGQIGAVLGPEVRLVDPAIEAVAELAWVLHEHDLLAAPDAPAAHQIVVTGDEERFALQAARILGVPVPPVRRVFLETLRLAGDRLQARERDALQRPT